MEDVDLDYEGMHKQMLKEKRGYKEQLHAVILGCVSLEFSVNDLIKIRSRKIKSDSLEEWSKNYNIPILAKIRMLRISDIVDERLYKNLKTLFKIRNIFAHQLDPAFFSKNMFEDLKDIDVNNDFVNKLPNDSRKFQLAIAYCFVKLLKISEKLDPNSVIHLEGVGDIVPLDLKE